MSNAIRVACEHCQSPLDIEPDDDTTHFKCAECGERTRVPVGIALARNLAADAKRHQDRSRSLRSIRNILALIGALLGICGLILGSYMQLNDGRLPWTPERTQPVVVVTTYP